MAELLLRGWDVAIPDVDVGDDVFVVDDSVDRVVRVQVKTSRRDAALTAEPVNVAFGGVAREDLTMSDLPFYYVFVLRSDRWEFVVIERRALARLRLEAESAPPAVGRPGRRPSADPKTPLTRTFQFSRDDVRIWGTSVQNHRNDWSAFPVISAGPGATSK